ncbi:unnamed protein product [Prunus armeniaca]|uniref:Uncharacterized protein n=1 Tax=Prunus armeniaca TaxID=36596 RepID=A0A6J5WDG1_PRUAR|nr:unnamed protein product [Prunus armeniaca]
MALLNMQSSITSNFECAVLLEIEEHLHNRRISVSLQLEKLWVVGCFGLETAIGPSEGTLKDKIIFPQLGYISFLGLPELKSFYSGGSGEPVLPVFNLYL